MLYTGGTTGMPKGVMYRIGDHASLFLNLGYPAVGLAAPSDRVGGRPRSCARSPTPATG